MAFQNVTDLNLGKILQISFLKGIQSQMSRDYRDFEQVQMMKAGSPDGREVRFYFQRSLGAAAVQYRNPGVTGAFPRAQQVSTSEHSAVFKELNATIELEYNLWKRAQISPAKYAEPLGIEIQSKVDAMKRLIGRDLYADGTGVVGTAASVVETSLASAGQISVTLSSADSARGHIGWFEYGDLVIPTAPNGTVRDTTGASALAVSFDSTSSTGLAYRVLNWNRATNTVVLELVNKSTGAIQLSDTASNIVAGDVFYRVGLPSVSDLSSPIADYGTASEVIAGLESLAASDGRVIHGITMSGASAGTTFDCGANPIDVSHIQAGMDLVKIRVGQGKYRWKKLCLSPEANANLIESRETDRRFQSIEDNKRGVKVFCYVHGDDTLEMYTSEFVPFKRAYALPESKGGEKVVQFKGTDFEPVKANDMSVFHLKPSSVGGHERTMVSYMMGLGTMIAVQPSAILRLQNFSA